MRMKNENGPYKSLGNRDGIPFLDWAAAGWGQKRERMRSEGPRWLA